MRLSVAIPTYNRGPKLAATIESILRSNMTGVESAEIIVVDDGSNIPAEEAVSKICCPEPFSLRFIRQANAGPGPARNAGFRAATGELVIFIDDDILVPPHLLQQYLNAHRKFPNAVIFGRSPFQQGDDNKSLRKFLSDAQLDPTQGGEERYIETPVIGSGHIAFSPTLFQQENRVYRDDLRAGSEEVDLSLRLRQNKIPYYFAQHIVAEHWQPVDLMSICRQHYKHSMGVAEAFVLCPGALELPVVADQLRAHGPVTENDPISLRMKKIAKSFLSSAPLRWGVVHTCAVAQHVTPSALRTAMYKLSLSLHFFAGFRDGIKRFSTQVPSKAFTMHGSQ